MSNFDGMKSLICKSINMSSQFLICSFIQIQQQKFKLPIFASHISAVKVCFFFFFFDRKLHVIEFSKSLIIDR